MKKTALAEAQWCLNPMLPDSGFSAYQMVFGYNLADLFGWQDGDVDLMFAQDTFLAGQFVQQWKLRMKAQEATLKAIANSKLRRLLAHNKTFNCAAIDVPFMRHRIGRALPDGEPPRKSWRLTKRE